MKTQHSQFYIPDIKHYYRQTMNKTELSLNKMAAGESACDTESQLQRCVHYGQIVKKIKVLQRRYCLMKNLRDNI